MEQDDAKAIIENLLFVADTPLPVKKIATIFSGEMEEEEVAGIIAQLAEEYESRNLKLSEVAEGWRIQTRPEYASWITAFFKMEKGQRLSRASLEVMAIVAYRQPITRTEIDEIRGVDCGGVLRGLIDKGLVKTMGRRRAPGKPMMYGTTPRFLEVFGLARLSDLPTLEEFQTEFGEGADNLASQASLALDGEGPDDGGDELAESDVYEERGGDDESYGSDDPAGQDEDGRDEDEEDDGSSEQDEDGHDEDEEDDGSSEQDEDDYDEDEEDDEDDEDEDESSLEEESPSAVEDEKSAS